MESSTPSEVLGGGGNALATVEEYDPTTNTWATRASMLSARYSPGVVAASNGRIYVMGGTSRSTLASVEEYDPETDTWRARASMPHARCYFGAAEVNGRIYAIGGTSEGGLVTAVDEYDLETDTWRTRADMPTPRWMLAVAAGNGKVYALGGDAGSGLLTMAEEYDPATNTWTTRASMPTAHMYFGAATAGNGRIYAVGGAESQSYGYKDAVDEYDPATDTWTSKAPLRIARSALAVAAAGNRIYAVGGSQSMGYAFATVQEATIITRQNQRYLPSVSRIDGWSTIVSEDFEGDFPGPWEVVAGSGSPPGDIWRRKTCRPYEGTYSGLGVQQYDRACGIYYPDGARSWMVFGPFSLAEATAADLSFKLWLNTEPDHDGVGRLASTDGVSFYGRWTMGNSNGWIDRVLDLADVPTLGNLMGQPQVWIALVFYSDGEANLSEGAYVDNIQLRKYVPPAGVSRQGLSLDGTSVDPRQAEIVDIPVRMARPGR